MTLHRKNTRALTFLSFFKVDAAWGAMGAEAAAYLSLESGEAACRTIEAEIIRRWENAV